MKIRSVYICEICNSEWRTEKEAEICEKSVTPEIPPFLKEGETLPAFGENGVVYGKITHIGIRKSMLDYPDSEHEYYVHTASYLGVSHNVNEEYGISIKAFDPRYGLDAFRYGCSQDHKAKWLEILGKYGFAIKDCDEYILKNAFKEV